MSGQKIIDGLKEAIAGDFAEVVIDGQHWVRKDNSDVMPLTAERDEAIAKLNETADRYCAEFIRKDARIADLEARLAEEKERCAKVCDEKAEATSVIEYAVAYELAADAIRSLPAQKGE